MTAWPAASVVSCRNRDSPVFFWVGARGWTVNWHDLAVAACLVLVLEGIAPFLSPPRWKNALRAVLLLDDRAVRLVGLGSMLAGTALLYWIN